MVHLYISYYVLQVQDYYLLLKMNDSNDAMVALYRLYLVGTMLRNVKVRGTKKAHDYPKIELTNLLILEYLRSIGHVAWKMISNNVSFVNEELGEMTFSVLSRCVLGDTLKSQFQHLSKMYTLLPIYRDIKNDIADDNGIARTISWRSVVDSEGEEVSAVAFFFKQLIRRMTSTVSIQTYDGTKQCYKNAISAATNMSSEVTSRVYDPNVLKCLPDVLEQIKKDIHGSSILSEFTHIWPGINEDDDTDSLNTSMNSLNSFTADDDAIDDTSNISDYVNSWERCTIGHYAVTRSEWPSSNGEAKTGICVYKIKSIDEEVEVYGEDIYHSFQGLDLSCSKPKYLRECATSGTWSSIRSDNNYSTCTVMSYHVIIFFEKLNLNGKLPRSVIHELDIAHRTNKLFTR